MENVCLHQQYLYFHKRIEYLTEKTILKRKNAISNIHPRIFDSKITVRVEAEVRCLSLGRGKNEVYNNID